MGIDDVNNSDRSRNSVEDNFREYLLKDVPTPILAIFAPCISLLMGLNKLIGSETPVKGEELLIGKLAFEAAQERLGAAFPGQGWRGFASETYDARNANQLNLLEAMERADAELTNIVEK